MLVLTAAQDETAPAAPQEGKPEEGPQPKEIRTGLATIRAALDAREPTPEFLGEQMRKAAELRAEAGQCQQMAEERLQRYQQVMTALGEKQADETVEIADRRKRVEGRRTKEEGRRAECRLSVVYADSLIARIDTAQKNLLKQRLMRHGPGMWSLVLWNLEHPLILTDAAAALAADGFHLGELDPPVLGLVLLAIGLGGVAGWLARRRHLARPSPAPNPTIGGQLGRRLLDRFARRAPTWLPLTLAAAVLVADDAGDGSLAYRGAFGLAIAGLLTARILIAALLGGGSPLREVFGLEGRLADRIVRALGVLAATLALVAILSHAPFRTSLPFEAERLVRGVVVTVLVLDLGWLTWLLGLVPKLQRSGRALRGGLITALLVVLVAEWIGYRNLALYLLEGLTSTAVIVGAFWLVGALLGDACAELDDARTPWSTRLRAHLGLERAEGFPGLLWIRLLATLSIWGGAGLLLLRAWGLSDTGTAMVLATLVDGFAIGDMQIVPAKVLTGVIVFAALLGVARWLRGWVETKWLSRSRMDRGAKDAMVTITGYVGFVVAALLGLSSAGVSLTNLALIASALSVGIGFGLQHVVSNFVAGLILLFERPVKTGDWVVVGNTEGIVKRIRVRATEIRTFERSDVSVPNSELINGAVKNWTLRDRVGRANIPIGVAYGSNTEMVRDLLLEVARAHPAIIQDTRGDPVKVLFRGFGDCALNFELSFTVRNVEDRGDVVSDLNFAIDKAFRAHRIEIPYPQHEVRIRGLEEELAEMAAVRKSRETTFQKSA
jgi:small-conductance mechanosensitive channel